MATALAPNPSRTYTPHGGAFDLWTCRDYEILFDGPAGTGKTRGVIEKSHLAAMKYPGARILWVRKTRASLTESVLVEFEEHVLPQDSRVKRGVKRSHRQAYHYPNGSTIVCGGLDNVDRIMSTEYDMVCLFEATEATKDDWEKMLTRLRNGVLPYQQAMADCNPSFPAHWLKKRADAGTMTRILSRHQDNPKLSEEYLARLASLSGHRRARLFMGQWVAAEGLVYDRWDEAVFVSARDDGFPRYVLGVDEGYTNPASMHVYGVDGDGRVHVLREWYQRQQLEESVVARARKFADAYELDAVVVDPSAAKLIAALEAADLPVEPADNDVFDGIQACQSLLQVAGDGIPRLTVDPSCKHFIEEISSYQWKANRDGSLKDEPMKANDHAMDEWRYAVRYIETTSGDMELVWL